MSQNCTLINDNKIEIFLSKISSNVIKYHHYHFQIVNNNIMINNNINIIINNNIIFDVNNNTFINTLILIS